MSNNRIESINMAQSEPDDNIRDVQPSLSVKEEAFLLRPLGMEPSPALLGVINDIKSALSNPDTSPDALRQLWTAYAEQFEALAGAETDPELYEKLQITAVIQKAFIFRDTGNVLRYTEELDTANMYAQRAGFLALSTVLDSEISRQIKPLTVSPERLIIQLRNKLSELSRVQLRDIWDEEQDYDSFLSHAYDMLVSEGQDPVQVLESMGVLDS